MTPSRSKGGLQRDAASDLWRHTLSQINNVFGRLLYLSGLRNVNTGEYEHHGLSITFGQKQTDKALRRSHEQVFDQWLNQSLEQQKADLDQYLGRLGENPRDVIRNWSRLPPGHIVPASLRQAQGELFLTDFRVLLGVLRAEYGVDEPDPDA